MSGRVSADRRAAPASSLPIDTKAGTPIPAFSRQVDRNDAPPSAGVKLHLNPINHFIHIMMGMMLRPPQQDVVNIHVPDDIYMDG
jgi:hypothetical protein